MAASQHLVNETARCRQLLDRSQVNVWRDGFEITDSLLQRMSLCPLLMPEKIFDIRPERFPGECILKPPIRLWLNATQGPGL
jgi:hypothetical protein